MNTGDVIRFNRPGFIHYAIFIGAETVAGNGVNESSVIHWWKDVNMLEPSVLITSFERLADDLCHETVNIEGAEIDFTQVVPRAIAFKQRLDALQMDPKNCRVLFDDSYHFVKWCRNSLGRIFITQEEIMRVRDPWRFVHGSLTNNRVQQNKAYNSKVLKELNPGDVIRYFHQGYEDWALYIGLLEGFPFVIHWWDRDSVDNPIIAIDDFFAAAGHCKAQRDSYFSLLDVNQRCAAFLAIEFKDRVAQFCRDIPGLFRDSRQFTFWCHFGLGASNLLEIPINEKRPDVRAFIAELKERSDPDIIRRNHNNKIQKKLLPGDIITFSKDSITLFAVCIDIAQDTAKVMLWTENGFITVDLFRKLAEDSKADIYTDRDNLKGAINWDEMVNKANALRKIVRDSKEDCNGLFSSSKHFAIWIHDQYRNPRKPEVQTNEPDVWQHVYGLKNSKISAETKAEIRLENKRILNALKEGDLVKYNYTRYTHYAVYIANCEDTGALSLIHWSRGPEAAFLTCGRKYWLRNDPFWTVTQYDAAHNGNNMEFEKNSCIDGHQVAEKAKQKLEEFAKQDTTPTIKKQNYHLFWNNCEHFANECRYGKKISTQVEWYVAPFKSAMNAVKSRLINEQNSERHMEKKERKESPP